jgi:hypothetical protein
MQSPRIARSKMALSPLRLKLRKCAVASENIGIPGLGYLLVVI